MRTIPCLRAAPTMLAVTCLAGCAQRLSVDEERVVTPREPIILKIDGPESEQRIRVQATSDAAPINVVIMLEKDVTPDTDEEVVREVLPSGALGHAIRKKEVTLEATIPPKKEFRVWITVAGRRATVKLKINSI